MFGSHNYWDYTVRPALKRYGHADQIVTEVRTLFDSFVQHYAEEIHRKGEEDVFFVLKPDDKLYLL